MTHSIPKITETLKNYQAEPYNKEHALNTAHKKLKKSAVLITLITRQQDIFILLTKRSQKLSNHAGQICFPGGRQDKADKNLFHTAIRETTEEVGIIENHINIIEKIDTHIVTSGYEITPIVAHISEGFSMSLNKDEVDDVFELPLSFILDKSNLEYKNVPHDGLFYVSDVWNFENWHIWGATASILTNLSQIISGKSIK